MLKRLILILWMMNSYAVSFAFSPQARETLLGAVSWEEDRKALVVDYATLHEVVFRESFGNDYYMSVELFASAIKAHLQTKLFHNNYINDNEILALLTRLYPGIARIEFTAGRRGNYQELSDFCYKNFRRSGIRVVGGTYSGNFD